MGGIFGGFDTFGEATRDLLSVLRESRDLAAATDEKLESIVTGLGRVESELQELNMKITNFNFDVVEVVREGRS
jgi:hypothetical protein